jgi:uncharacterized protein (DUF302 family)
MERNTKMSITETTFSYGRAVVTKLGYEQAVEQAKQLLKDEGFGVLCEIDVAATMREKLGTNIEPYRILGACNPTFAHSALSHHPQLGLLLPCNVVVQRSGDTTIVSAIDARALLGIVGKASLQPIADEVTKRLYRLLDRIEDMERAS